MMLCNGTKVVQMLQLISPPQLQLQLVSATRVKRLKNLATPGGLEPPTFSLEGCCSIR
jgi:hypothetical protein